MRYDHIIVEVAASRPAAHVETTLAGVHTLSTAAAAPPLGGSGRHGRRPQHTRARLPGVAQG